MVNFIAIFTIIGILCTITALIMVIMVLIERIKDIIDHYKRKYQQKHRFDKPPTAKCYCIDCKYRTEYEECCVLGGCFKVADNWFCWKAEPKD